MPSINSEDTDFEEPEAPVARLEQMQDDVLNQLDQLNEDVLSLIGDAMKARAAERHVSNESAATTTD